LHILRRAAIFLLPLLFLAALLYVLDRWSVHQKNLKIIPPKKTIVGETKKNDVEYKLKTLDTATVEPNAVVKDNKGTSFFTVVLDPTHGGDDVGAIGYKSVVESNLNLHFAFKLARALRMRGIKVYVTRMDDVNISTDTRIKEAIKKNPNLFLSVNCSYSDLKSLRGMEIYGFTPSVPDDGSTGDGATKTQSAMAVENRVSLAIKEDLNLAYKSGLERKFLSFMSLPADIPALGIFIGYISNSEDVEQLENDKFIDGLTERIAASVEKGLLKKL
jgi:N-acetylmuramoyl-L-alanine amidase